MTTLPARRLAQILLAAFCCLTVISCSALYTDKSVQETKDEAGIGLPYIQDDFAELDDTTANPYVNDYYVNSTLELGRQHYISALTHIDHGDTTLAARSFERSIEVLNGLINFPHIERNAEFGDLMQSVIDDYESFIQSIDDLDENSPIFILRDKLFQVVEGQYATPGDAEQITQVSLLEMPDPEEHHEPVLPPSDNLQIPLDVNEYVQNAITYFSGSKGRKFMQSWLERSGRWFPMMRNIAREEEVPEEIVFLSMIESGLNPNAVSRAQAVGLWQFIKSTGEIYGLDVSYWHDERRDPEKATRAAVRHLRDLYNDFGDWHLAMAAYNCGPGGVRRAIRRSGLSDPDFWQIRRFLPRETRNYVPLYIATTTICLYHEQYGFSEIQYEPPYRYETVEIPEAVDFEALATNANLQTSEIADLNPELLRACTPPDQTYNLKVPLHMGGTVQTAYEQMPDSVKRSWVLHTVEARETLSSISRKYGVATSLIAAANDMTGTRMRLSHGQLLRIPMPNVSEELEQQLASSQDDGGQRAAGAQAGGKKKIYHKVGRGETLLGISKQYGVRIADLRNWNNIPYNSNYIRANSTLTVYLNGEGESEAVASNSQPASSGTPEIVEHRVRRGETVGKIADTYGVNIASIRHHNKLNRRNTIYPGQLLRIPVSGDARRSVASTQAPTRNKVIHRVRRGETIGEIAELYGVRTGDIRSWNSSKVRGTRIIAGDALTIYTANVAKGGGATGGGSAPKIYTVRRGDTFASIARKFGVSVNTLQRLNSSVNARRMQIGQKIRIQ